MLADTTLKNGLPVMLVTAEGSNGRGRGLMVASARHATAKTVTIMAVWARGIVGVTVSPEMASRLGLRRLDYHYRFETRDAPVALASVEAARGVSTGISAEDRATTLRVVGSPASAAKDLVCPGHVVPILIVGRRDGSPTLPEIAHRMLVDVGLSDGAAICDVLNDHGELASAAECRQLAQTLDLRLIPADDQGKFAIHPERMLNVVA